MRQRDEIEEPDRLLKATRACGWLSYRADPVSKKLIRCDQEDWMRDLKPEAALPEETHRHPKQWWQERYQWIGEGDEPYKPDFKGCGYKTKEKS